MSDYKLPTKVYLAGRISKNDWRHQIVPGLRQSTLFPILEKIDIGNRWRPWPILKKSILNYYDYVGPYFVSCDHGCAHGPNTHGSRANESGGCLDGYDNFIMKSWAYSRCITAIEECEMLVAWIDDTEAFGTLTEIGFANALRKDITILSPIEIKDYWFVYEMATLYKTNCDPDPAKSVLDFLKLWVVEPEINYYDYIKSSSWRARAGIAKEAAGFRCQLCNRHKDEVTLHAHHRTYERLGDELPEDITVLCADCHAKFHDKVNYG